MRYLLTFLFFILTSSAYAGETTIALECTHKGTIKFSSGNIRDYKPDVEHLSIKLHNGTPISIESFDAENCSFGNNIIACEDRLPMADGNGYFDRTFTINQYSGSFGRLVKMIEGGTLYSDRVGGGFCIKSKHKKLF